MPKSGALLKPDDYSGISHMYHFKDVQMHDTKPDTMCHRLSLEREPKLLRRGESHFNPDLGLENDH